LIDSKKTLSLDKSADEMVYNLRQEVKKNRALCYDRLGVELQEKENNLAEISMVIQGPSVTT